MVKLNRYRLIPDRRTGEDYMHRYYLFLKDRKYFPFNVTLHKIVKSDDPIFHDHPWPYATIILKGGYYEWTPKFNALGERVGAIRKWRGPGSVILRTSKAYHYLEVPENGSATTLFFMGPQFKEWGFLSNKNNSWIKNQEHLSNPSKHL